MGKNIFPFHLNSLLKITVLNFSKGERLFFFKKNRNFYTFFHKTLIIKILIENKIVYHQPDFFLACFKQNLLILIHLKIYIYKH